MCPLKLIPDLFKFDDGDLPPELRAQRVLYKGRIPHISRYIVENPDLTPFEYMRKKIESNQEKVDNALNVSAGTQTSEENAVNNLLDMDLFFPKRRLEGVVNDVYRFWESWIIRKHIQRSRHFKTI